MIQDYSSALLHSWTTGVEEFNQGRFWHAHEEWERGWKNLPSREKTYVQALIQFAAVFHLFELGRSRPALSLCTSALTKFEAANSIHEVLPRIEIVDAVALLKQIARGAEWTTLRGQLQAVLLLPPSV